MHFKLQGSSSTIHDCNIIHEIHKMIKQTNKYGRGTERHLPKTDESVANTYRDENETKMNILAQTQRPSSAVEYKKLKRNFKVPPR